jgi:cell division protein FtsX
MVVLKWTQFVSIGVYSLLLLLLLLLLLFIYLNCKCLLTRWQMYYSRPNTQMTHITQNNTSHSKQNTAHKTTQAIKDTKWIQYKYDTMQQLQLSNLIKKQVCYTLNLVTLI